jgi:hypothetical protein
LTTAVFFHDLSLRGGGRDAGRRAVWEKNPPVATVSGK